MDSEAIIDATRRRTAVRRQDQAAAGLRVRLIHTTDAYTRLQPGTEGTITFVDGLGTVHVDWDDGTRLGLVADAGDRYEILPTPHNTA